MIKNKIIQIKKKKDEEANKFIQPKKWRAIIKDKIKESIFSPVFSIMVNGQKIEPDEVMRDDKKCPNLWVYPSLAMKGFFILYIASSFIQVGKIISAKTTTVEYNSVAPLAENHPFRKLCEAGYD